MEGCVLDEVPIPPWKTVIVVVPAGLICAIPHTSQSPAVSTIDVITLGVAPEVRAIGPALALNI